MCVVLPLSLFHADGMPKAKGSLSDNVQTRDPPIPAPSPHAARSPSFHDLTPTEDSGTFHVNLPPFNDNDDSTPPSEAAGRHYLSSYIHFNRYFHFPHAKLVDLDRMGITSEDSTPDITRIHSVESMESVRSGSNTTVISEQVQRVDSALKDMEVKDDRDSANVSLGLRLYKLHKLSKTKMVEKNSNSSKPNDNASQSTGVFPRKDSLALDSYISIHKDAIRLQNSGMIKSKPKSSSELLKPAEVLNDTRDATKANEVHLHDKIVPKKVDAKLNEAVESKKANYLPDDLITFKGRAKMGQESDVDPLKSRIGLANKRLLRYSSQSSPVGDDIGRVRFSSDVDILEFDADTSGQCFRRLCCCYRAPPIKEEDITELQPGTSILVKTNYSTEELTENVCLNIRDDVPTVILEYNYKEQT